MIRPSVSKFGDSAILISWPKEISEDIISAVRKVDFMVRRAFKNQLLETVITYQSLALYLNPEVNQLEIMEAIENCDFAHLQEVHFEARLWEIPVCYSPIFGIDLNEISQQNGLSTAEIITLHSTAIYSVYFIGFLPGFLYLGGLPPKIHVPRRTTPRLIVPSGAVGIGGGQTGIYPIESPGGWNIIGQTPIKLFDVNTNPPISIQPEDRIKFTPISEARYHDIVAEVAAGSYVLPKSSVL